MFEEPLVVVPRILSRTLRQARQIFRVFDWLITAPLRGFSEQSEIKPLDRFTAFLSQLGADANLIFHAGNFVASRTPEVTNPFRAFSLQVGILHEGGIRIGGRIFFSESDQIARDVAGIVFA